MFAAFGRWNILGWHGRERQTLTFRPPGEVALTPAQGVTAWFFFVMVLLFLIQSLVGGASQHYRGDLQNLVVVQFQTEPLPKTSSESTWPAFCRSTWHARGTCN